MIFRFGEFELCSDRRELRDAEGPVALQAKAFEVLLVLVWERARVVPSDELRRLV